MKRFKYRQLLRRKITGDENYPIRHYVEEKRELILLFDKIAFTIGVINNCFGQFFIFNLPTLFYLWYSVVITISLMARTYHFRSLKLQYFMYDFCYFTLLCSFIHLYIIPNNVLFAKIVFIFSNGPLLLAIIVWRNSFVFHDYDKITSVYIHLLPSLLTYCGRWYGYYSFNSKSTLYMTQNDGNDAITINDYFAAALVYVIWQIIYFYITEVMDRIRLDQDPYLLTSLRWMSTDLKNPVAHSVLLFCRKIGIFKANEFYNNKTFKTKVVFMVSQFLYTMATFAGTNYLYRYQGLQITYIIGIYVLSIFYGASFYIEIFSKRYISNIEAKTSKCPIKTSIEENDMEILDIDR